MDPVNQVRSFWESHLNNEYYTKRERNESEYFDEIRKKRYKYHYHLPPLHTHIAQECQGPLLEVGCGIAVDGETLSKAGISYLGVDLTFSALRVARKRFDGQKLSGSFVQTSGEELPFREGTFAGVYSFGVIHHTPNMQRAIEEIYRVLRPGGKAWIMIYAKWSLVNLIHIMFRLPYESPKALDDHCPVVIRSSVQAARRSFGSFEQVLIAKDYPFTYGMRKASFFAPLWFQRVVGKCIGWHIMIEARK